MEFTSSSELPSSSILSTEAAAASDWPSASLARFFAILNVKMCWEFCWPPGRLNSLDQISEARSEMSPQKFCKSCPSNSSLGGTDKQPIRLPSQGATQVRCIRCRQ